ncbi:ribbon-helix-helix protein, CopG family [Candidatus Woesearchaeota archaeon]|nr:ribbon-helix-helix protein, CopG family [Candidatus Woesearchaeota archaeon]
MTKKIPFPVSVDEEIVEKINREVEKGVFRNRSHLVEQAILNFKKKRELGTLAKFTEEKDEK